MKDLDHRILSTIKADLDAILERGYPQGYGWGNEKWAHDLATENTIRTNPGRWTGWGMDMSPSQRTRFTRILDRLQAAGLIQRLSTYADGNLTHVRLTDDGKAALAAHQGGQVDA